MTEEAATALKIVVVNMRRKVEQLEEENTMLRARIKILEDAYQRD